LKLLVRCSSLIDNFSLLIISITVNCYKIKVYVPFKNLSNPIDFGLSDTYGFMLDHDGVKLGAW